MNKNIINLYILINEIIYKSNNIFNIFDKIIKIYINFYNSKFEIRLINKNKLFKLFYIRFNAIITLLYFIEIFKILNFIYLILTRF